jgi:hypothetical protein
MIAHFRAAVHNISNLALSFPQIAETPRPISVQQADYTAVVSRTVCESSGKMAWSRYTPAILVQQVPVAIMPSQRLGPYEILLPVVAHGTTEVHRAHDDRLNTIPAIHTDAPS